MPLILFIVSNGVILLLMAGPASQKLCHACTAVFPAHVQAGFRDVCPSCQAYLHCCKNCRLYDPNAHHQCRSSTTDFVQDKEKANFCEEFDWMAGSRPDAGRGQEGKKGWDDLFS